MAFKAAIDSTEKGERLFLQRDKDTKKPVYLFVRMVEDDFARELRKKHARGVRAEKVGKLPAAELVERGIETKRAYANRALVDSEGFEVALETPATAAAFAQALGVTSLEAGAVVTLDGRWNDAVKRLVFAVVPGLVDWINGKSDELSNFEAEDEEASKESFR